MSFLELASEEYKRLEEAKRKAELHKMAAEAKEVKLRLKRLGAEEDEMEIFPENGAVRVGNFMFHYPTSPSTSTSLYMTDGEEGVNISCLRDIGEFIHEG